MNIVFLLYKYFPYGGMQRDCLSIARAAVAAGHQVTILTLSWQGEHPMGITIVELPVRAIHNHLRYQRFARVAWDWVNCHNTHVTVGFNKIPGVDIYYCADPCYQAKMLHRSWWSRSTARYRHFFAYEKAIFAPNARSHILSLSDVMQAEYQQIYATPTERFTLLPPNIGTDRTLTDNDEKMRELWRQQQGILPDEKFVLLLGSGFKTKGLDRAMRACATLPPEFQWRLGVVGQDNIKPFLRMAKSLGISQQVMFLGGRGDVPALLQAADVLIHPAYRENTGTVLVEAILTGLPVITTAVCGYAHYVAKVPGCHVLPEPFSQQQLNNILLQRLSNLDRQQSRQAAIRCAQQQNWHSGVTVALSAIEARGAANVAHSV